MQQIRLQASCWKSFVKTCQPNVTSHSWTYFCRCQRLIGRYQNFVWHALHHITKFVLAAVANAPNNFALPYDLWVRKCNPTEKVPTHKIFSKLHYKENGFQLKSDIIYCREKNPVYNPCHSGSFFRIRSPHVNLNWLILLQVNLRPYGNQVFWCKQGSS